MSKLAKPHFIKVNSLVDARNGYNVYVKVVSTEEVKSQDEKQTFVKAVVADETGSANAFFKGQPVPLIKKGATIAIRNGRIRLMKSHICLQIDIFGRITPQAIQIKENTENNISNKQIERRKKTDRRGPPRRGGYEGRPRRQYEDRRPRREDHQERPRRRRQEDEERPRRRRQEDEERPRRREQDRRPPRQDRKYEDRPPREDRRPRRDHEERGDRRPPTNWTKIGAIQPGDQELNIVAKVISTEKVGRKMRLVLGDQTGIIKGFMYGNDALEKDNTVVIFKGTAAVVKEHIELQLMERGKVDVARRKIEEVNKKYDVSEKEWVESA